MSIWTPERCRLAQAEARRWHGTPHRDGVCEAGVGVDCIRLVVAILTASGVTPAFTFPAYDVQEGLHDLSTRMRDGFLRCAHCHTVSKLEPQFGDIAICRTGRMSGHCAFVMDDQVVHSLARRSVIISSYRPFRPTVDCLIRLDAVGLREQPSGLWQDTRD